MVYVLPSSRGFIFPFVQRILQKQYAYPTASMVMAYYPFGPLLKGTLTKYQTTKGTTNEVCDAVHLGASLMA